MHAPPNFSLTQPQMKNNLAYYAENARSFFDNTVDVDMASLHEAFLSNLVPDASILDAGCGSGLDAKAFVQRGYSVTAFDASAPLARRRRAGALRRLGITA